MVEDRGKVRQRPCTARSARTGRRGALLLALFLVATGCGGAGDGTTEGTTATTGGDEGTPTPGGKVVYGLEAESSGGWCLQEAQLAIAGIQIARTIYDTLTAPNADGEYVPFLAESVSPNATYDKWTIELRPDVKFHDGSPLTAEVVKNNLDAYRGTYPTRHPLLFLFVYENIKDVAVVGPLTVEVTTKTPWPSFPSYLFSSGRVGITAQAQLDDEETCATKPIGTGPFKFKEWKVNDHFAAVKNPDYWQEGLPYLDEIEYRPIPEGSQIVNALQAGEITAMHASGAEEIVTLRDLAASGDVRLVEGVTYPEVGYVMLNAGQPPFDKLIARKAMAYAADRETIRQIRDRGVTTNASGPFGPGNMGYLEDTGYPEFDLDKAKALVKQYEDETGLDFEFTLSSTPDTGTLATSQLVKEMAEKAGAKVDLKQVEQAQLISDAIGGNFQAVLWRNHPGGDPDSQYVWWHSGSPVNFGRINDPEIDRLLDEGRQEADPAQREKIYQDLNRRFADQLWNLWAQWTVWDVATAPDVHGVLGPDLPDGSKPFPGLGTGHPVTGLWIEP